MLIINADDWGLSRAGTDPALSCYTAGRITSGSAMVFMSDSIRAAEIAKDIGIDIGLHLNLSTKFTGECHDKVLLEYHDRIVQFLTSGKYSFLIYNPSLKEQFRYTYRKQIEEFLRLYGKPPSHVDGHHHKHICANMLFDKVIPAGEKVRRNISFLPGEKSLFNRTCRRLLDLWLARRYRLIDFVFEFPEHRQLETLRSFVELARGAIVEIMVHPVYTVEYACLMSDDYLEILQKQTTGTYSLL